MIEGEDDYWTCENGTKYKVGETIPVLRIQGVVLFNEMIVLGSCDMCDWRIIGPTSLVQQFSQQHIETHVMAELGEALRDDFRHPDYTE